MKITNFVNNIIVSVVAIIAIISGIILPISASGAIKAGSIIYIPKSIYGGSATKTVYDDVATITKTVSAVITAYSSTPEETDDTPFITARGTNVRDGIIANNCLPFGTKIRIPTIYGDKIFTVEDRMNKRMGCGRFDIWFSSHRKAEIFGVASANIEVIKVVDDVGVES